ncbi:hypothetical protein KUV62_15780 [Salipiger bermudensis]|uniref:hypothetical protein n=1 Tax=Salipiger bermudensis TaxID=344736 RepID=UPI001C9914A0|nr:hypothetical protein [Salipiger bermudensis]MBY6005385.1 hypothetical protein [Salipiger bermudensis]
MGNKIEGEKNLTRRGRGRPKGSPNKTTATAKAMIEEAADKLGGAKRMVAWAQEDPANERAFWATIYPKLIPVQVANPDGETFKTEEVGKGATKLAEFLNGIAERSGETGEPSA